ncbi:MAG: hypothetical protein LBG79_02075 [Spirochaetaceae bacterium]|jgi:hypothetical protein|nr:hypothetical protein [Spirochaetaceae bacterium]
MAAAGCASYSFDGIDEDVRNARYDAALKKLEKEKKIIYKNDAVRYYLDTGMIAHFSAQYEDSIKRLQNGDRAIEAAWTKSISQSAASFIANDTAVEYAGEDYEDLYLNVFNALNYYHCGNIEDALVEIRRMQEKLRKLSMRYNAAETELARRNMEAAKKADVKVNFSNSALARYLSMLFYRAEGSRDDARIDRDELKRAFEDQKNIYPYAPPSNIDDELSVPEDKARINFLAFAGLSPVKEEETIRIPLADSNSWIKIALPRMKARPSTASKIEVVFDSGEKVKLALLEDIERVATETFKKHKGIIEAKSIIRGTVKGGIAAGLMAADDDGALLLLGIAAQLFAETSEHADLRIARYFPARAYTGAINLKPGKYSFTVNYYNNSGKIAASFDYKDVVLKQDGLNLIETVFLD